MTIKAAYFTNAGKTISAKLALTIIEDGRREVVETRNVSGKREARKIAEAAGFQPWNF